MKLLKSILRLITILLAFLSIAVSIGSSICKFSDVSNNVLVLACPYLSYFWVIILSVVVLFLFLALKNFRIALTYFAIMLLFTLLLNDFSLKPIHRRIPDKDKTYDSLNVGAYNIKYYAYGIGKISKFISESDFDVLLLSESVLTPEKLTYLKSSLPHYTVLTDNGHDLSILSKYPVLDYKIIDLPTYLASLSSSNDIDKLKAGGIHRSFVHAVINVNGTVVNILSLRLIAGRPKNRSLKESIRWGKYLINAQEEEVAVFLDYLRSLKGPVIFGGDLNVQPNTNVIRQIKNYAVDTFLEEHFRGPYTFKLSFPTMRIDYLFHSSNIISKNSERVNVKTLLSDHFPVRAEFFIPRNSSSSVN
ncbi:MAG: endonuclease/exonuclease/phosphatase family protein [Bacteroidales bacterium]